MGLSGRRSRGAESGPAGMLGAEHGMKHGEEGRAVGLGTVAREWLRIGCIGFGGPPAHIALLRKLCVQQRGWLSAEEFADGVATTNLLPWPASTQLAMFCAWRLAGPGGAVVGGAFFILPGLGVTLALAALFLAAHPPAWIAGAAAGAGAAVPAVALAAAVSLMPASWRRAGAGRARWRLVTYLVAGGLAGVLAGAFILLRLAARGLLELAARWPRARHGPQAGSGSEPAGGSPDRQGPVRAAVTMPLAYAAPAARSSLLAASALLASGGLLAVAWGAFKVGARS